MSFKDIKGHTSSIKLLQIALSGERQALAHLFIGEEGIGKRLVARTLAKAINCLKSDGLDTSASSLDFARDDPERVKRVEGSLSVNGVLRQAQDASKDAEQSRSKQSRTIDSCDQCASCKRIDNFNHPDVHWVMPESISNSIKIEQIRQLKNDISLRPYEAKKKVFIIDEAHCLTPEAANAFLKVLEEPPLNSLIILITSKPKLIFSTILSRCQKLRFYPLKKNELNEFLFKELKLDAEASHYLAYFCEGRLGKALNLKEGDILREKNMVIDGFVFSNNIHKTKEFDREGFKRDLDILASWFRDIYFLKVGVPFMELINLDRKNELLKVMSRYSFLELDSIINFISNSALYLKQNVNPKLILSNLRERIWKG